MAISAKTVKELRDMTGAGMMDCKKALTETDGDMEKAVAWLREKGLAKAAKKAGRATSEGLIAAHTEGSVGVLAEVKCETDFVAKNEKFQEFVDSIARQVAETDPADPEALLAAPYAAGEGTVQEAINALIAVIGENLQMGRFVRFELSGEGGFGTYIHANGKIGVLIEFGCPASVAAKPEFETFGRDVAMQIAALNPVCVRPEELPSDLLEQEKAIYKKQAMEEGKPEEIAEKIVVGRLNKYYKEVCLIEQPFVKDDKQTIKSLVKSQSKTLGGEIEIRRFTRIALGEDAGQDD